MNIVLFNIIEVPSLRSDGEFQALLFQYHFVILSSSTIKKGEVHPRTGHDGPGCTAAAVLFHLGRQVVMFTPRPLSPSGKRPGTRCTRGWVDLMARLDRCEESILHRDSLPGLSNPQRFAIPTELSRSALFHNTH